MKADQSNSEIACDRPKAASEDRIAQSEWFVAELARLATDRKATESSIEAQLQAGQRAAQRTFDEAQAELAEWLQLARIDLERDHAEMCRHAATRMDHDTAKVDDELKSLEQSTEEEFNQAIHDSKSALKEARWEAETLYDAAKHLPSQYLHEFEHNLEAGLENVRQEREEAQRLLEEWRQPVAEDIAGATIDAPPIEGANLQLLLEKVATARAQLAELKLPAIVAGPTLPWTAGLIGLALAAIGFVVAGPIAGAAVAVITAVVGFVVNKYLARVAATQVAQTYPLVVRAACEAEAFVATARQQAQARAASKSQELVDRRDRAIAVADTAFESSRQEAMRRREGCLAGPTSAYPARMAEIRSRHKRDLELAENHRTAQEAEIRRRESEQPRNQQRLERELLEIDQRAQERARALDANWRVGLDNLKQMAESLCGHAVEPLHGWLAGWSALAERDWAPAADAPQALRIGEMHVGLDESTRAAEGYSNGSNAAVEFVLPALVRFPENPSLLLKATREGRQSAIGLMQAYMLRLLVSLPPGKLRFTIIDPVGLGENFAAFMHLADFDEALVNSRIWTEPRHIEARLADLSEHMEIVIQKYLRNEFKTIQEYNRDAGEIAEPIRFLVIANFPTNFSESAARRLVAIANSGARCGVYTLIMVDQGVPLPPGTSLADFEENANTILVYNGRAQWADPRFGKFELVLDTPPEEKQVTEILQTAGRYASQASRVEVPFAAIAPEAAGVWTHSAASGIDVPLGRVGATRLQAMRLGHGTSQHVLVAGKTGSGKSTLLHALITNIGLRYSPDEVELYLVDFKQGVEFKGYATHRMPHARVVAIESDREFGLSVLERLDVELKRRADRFRALGVQDLPGFRQAVPTERMPRLLLIVDEFQEFFVEDDKVSQDAALLLDRLVRQGRAFGIHVLLGTQTLAGAYSLARSTIGQMAVRIALQCSETDAHLILSEENSAARLLSRPGEAIYNDSNGLVEGNHPFQIVWLPERQRQSLLIDIANRADAQGTFGGEQVVFEGNVPADPAKNRALAALLSGTPDDAQLGPAHLGTQAWLGEAVAIKEPTSAMFRAQSGNNLLVVGQNEDAVLGMFAMAAISLAAERQPSEAGSSRFVILDGSAEGSAQCAALAELAHTLSAAAPVGRRELPVAVAELAAEIARRQSSGGGPFAPIYVFVHGVHKLRDLRKQEDDFGFSRGGENQPADPGKQMATILRDGPPVSVHVVAWCDSVSNLTRTWDRQSLREFEMRVALQMSVNDSSTLVDTPIAARLGPHRALFHHEQQGLLEKFRPYRWPTESWLDETRIKLQSRSAKSNKS